MPQIQLPIFPVGVTPITACLAFNRVDDQIYYLNGHLPVFIHHKDDLKAFRLFTSQMIENGSCKTSDITRAFGVPNVTVKRALKCLRDYGSEGFYISPKKKSSSKLNAEVSEKAQAFLDAGHSVPDVGRTLDILPNTIHKAIRAGRLRASSNGEMKKKQKSLPA